MSKIILVGAGPMAIQYAKVLEDLKAEYKVIGRGESSALKFESETGKSVIRGGLDTFLGSANTIDKAILATGVEALAENTRSLLNSGYKNILVEKPAGLNALEISELAKLSKKLNASVFVAYNRRFYQSVEKAMEIIKDDGGISSFHFEFTEVGFKIKDLHKAPGVKENWFLANSTHVVDLAFFLGGKPKELSAYQNGYIAWHDGPAQFVGAGLTIENIPFSYHANWDAPGRWSVELMTPQNRIILAPMEGLKIQKLGSFEINEVKLSNDIDQKFKAGLFNQTNLFLQSKIDNRFCTISEVNDSIQTYLKISGYKLIQN